MKEKYCGYCRRFKSPEGFKKVVHHPSGSTRLMCSMCQEIRKRPHAELVELAEAEKKLKGKR